MIWNDLPDLMWSEIYHQFKLLSYYCRHFNSWVLIARIEHTLVVFDT